MYENRQFAIFSLTEIDKIDFSQVLETSADTLRKSVDGTRSFVKWDSITPPPSVEALTTIQGFYTYEEILDILSTDEWSGKMMMEEV
jgi:hypothetical protein